MENRISLSLSGVIAEACNLVAGEALRRRIRIDFDMEGKLPPIAVDRIQIQQVLVNLFRNALEAMAPSTHRELIASNTRAADDMIEIAVSDTGSGFAGDDLSNLFQPFFTTKETGMGVGLSISRTIIETHGGRMWAETNEAGGATFRFTLPVAPAKDTIDVAG